jgi:hypothetical protein
MKPARSWFMALALIIPPDSAFQHQAKIDGVDVFFADSGAPDKWVRGTSVLQATRQQIFTILKNVADYAKVFSEHLAESQVLSSSDSNALGYFRWPLPFPMSDRDAIVQYRFADRSDVGESLVEWESSEHPNDPAKALRIKSVKGHTRLFDLADQRTKIEYTYYGDLGGDLANWIKERAWREEPVFYIKAIAARLNSNKP